MGKTSAPYVQPAQPDPYAVEAEQRAQNQDIATAQTDLASQTANLQRQFGAMGGVGGMLAPAGAVATGSLNGTPSIALAPLGALAFSAGR